MTVILLGGPAVTLTTAASSISTQPAASAATAGANATFKVAAAGCPAPTYQWQRQASGTSTWQDLTESSTYSGVQTATLTVAATTTAMSGDQFRAQTTNSAGSATSNTAMLTVTAPAAQTPMTPVDPPPKSGGGGELDVWMLLALAALVTRTKGLTEGRRPSGGRGLRGS